MKGMQERPENDGDFSVLIVSSDQYPLATQLAGLQFQADGDRQHFERDDGQGTGIDERLICRV